VALVMFQRRKNVISYNHLTVWGLNHPSTDWIIKYLLGEASDLTRSSLLHLLLCGHLLKIQHSLKKMETDSILKGGQCTSKMCEVLIEQWTQRMGTRGDYVLPTKPLIEQIYSLCHFHIKSNVLKHPLNEKQAD